MSKKIITALPIVNLHGDSSLLEHIQRLIKVKNIVYTPAYKTIDPIIHRGANIVAYQLNSGVICISRWNDSTLYNDLDYQPSVVSFNVEQFAHMLNKYNFNTNYGLYNEDLLRRNSIRYSEEAKAATDAGNKIHNRIEKQLEINNMKIDFKKQVVIGDNNITKEELALIIEENHINIQQQMFDCDKKINSTEREIIKIKTTHPLNINEYINLTNSLNKLESDRAILNALEGELGLDGDTIFRLKN